MGCPMFQKKVQIQLPTQYPFQELYRPWSWTVSSLANVTIFLLLLLLCYALYRRSRSQRRRELGNTPFRMVKGDGVTEEGRGRVKVLVTGGCGCLGRRLIRALVKDGGYEVYCLDLFIPEEESRPPGVTSFVSVDLGDRQSLELAMNQLGELDVVFHVAGLIPKVHTRDSDLYRVNKSGTQYLLDICNKVNKVKSFIYTSTGDVLISNNKREELDDVSETWPIPKVSCNAYCGSKKEAEQIVIDSNGCNGMVTCSLRCASLGHPDSSVFCELFHIRGMYIGNGLNKHSVVDIDQCALAHILAEKKLRAEGVESLVAGAIYHLSGDTFTYKELMEYSPDDSGVTIWGHPQPFSIPKWVFTIIAFINVAAYTVTGYAPVSSSVDMSSVHFLSRSYSFSGKKAKRELGWPEQPSWKETVEKIVNEYEERLEKKKNK